MAVTFDGASANRLFLKLLGSEKVQCKVVNKHTPERRRLFFSFSDPPHLLKTARNCLASKARHLWVSSTLHCIHTFKLLYFQRDESNILFQHITELYYRDREKSMGLLLLPKIKLEHIQVTSFSRMWVDLAAQVLQQALNFITPCLCVFRTAT